MRFLYTLLLTSLIPLALLRLFWRGWHAPAYWQNWTQRFGNIPRNLPKQVIWIHAVSVGEVQAALPLIKRLQQDYPDYPVLVTTMTPTGAQQLKHSKVQVDHCYLPYDLPFAIQRFLNQTQPRLVIFMETELWPNWLNACKQRNIPFILANGRLSERSLKGYQRYLSTLMRSSLACIHRIAAQSEADAQRFQQLGATPAQIVVTGSLKFDCKLPHSLHEQGAALRRQWDTRLSWIAASTHEGEDEQVLTVFSALKQQFPDLLLILVPRHPERFNRVANLCLQAGFKIARRSENQICDKNTDIYLGDTMGELPLLYAAADVAFIGGSLVKTGGHNMIEAAMLGVPIVMGKYVFNFATISKQLQQKQAMQIVKNKAELTIVLAQYLNDANLRHQHGENGRLFVEQNKGTLGRLLKLIDEVLG